MGGVAFDPSKYEDTNSLVPQGDYYVEVEKAEVRDTQSGDGRYIKVQFNILGQTQTGRKVFVNYNMANKSDMAVEIGQREFAALCKAAGVAGIQDTDEILGKRALVKVSIRKNKRDNTEENAVGSYRPVDGTTAPTPPPAPPAQAAPPSAAAAPAAAKLPWER
jgi:hypothetical protein